MERIQHRTVLKNYAHLALPIGNRFKINPLEQSERIPGLARRLPFG
jgi:hypothetical protein